MISGDPFINQRSTITNDSKIRNQESLIGDVPLDFSQLFLDVLQVRIDDEQSPKRNHQMRARLRIFWIQLDGAPVVFGCLGDLALRVESDAEAVMGTQSEAGLLLNCGPRSGNSNDAGITPMMV